MTGSAAQHAGHIEQLLDQLGEISDPQSRETAHDLVTAILELQGAALRRMLELMEQAGEPGQIILKRIARDGLTGGMLALHGLHPDSIEIRVRQVIAAAGMSAELVNASEESVVVRLRTSSRGAKEQLESLIKEIAPDAARVTVEQLSSETGFVPLAALRTQ